MSSQERDESTAGTVDEPAELRTRLELLETENRRLREEYRRIRQTRHRRTAIGLGVIGLAALVGALLFPAGRTVLVILGATGVFGGLLTWYLTPDRFVAADVGERVYTALAENHSEIVDELGLSDERVYVPTPDSPERDVVLFIPQLAADAEIDGEQLESVFVVGETDADRGLALRPTGEPLLEELGAATPGGLATEPASLVDQLVDGLREQFELVEHVRTELDLANDRASIAVSGSVFGDLDRFDQPVASLFACGLAVGLNRSVELDVDRTPDGREAYLVTVRWDDEQPNSAEAETSAARRS